MFSAAEKKVYIKTTDDKLLDAATGKPAAGAPPDDIDTVSVNNRLRSIIDAAHRRLDPDGGRSGPPLRRRASGVQVARSRAPCRRSTRRSPRKPMPRVKKALIEARAAVILNSAEASAADKIAAIAVIGDRGDQDALGLLDGLPANLPPDVHNAARAASAKIQSNLAIWSAVQNAWYGLSLGSVLLLAAIGLAITFGVMGVINMAHGEMVMLGAYTTFVVQEIIRSA